MDFEEKLKEIYVQPSLPKELAEKFTMLSCLKYGESKQIYLIEENGSGNRCVLKCADGEYEPLLKKECLMLKKAGGAIHCPAVVSYTKSNGTGYLIREYISGETIRELVEKQKVSETEVYRIISGVCANLEKLHALEPPVIMRDIKPENIVVSDGECIMIDFDAAREWKEDRDSDTEYIGTRATAAPEQFGYSQTDKRTDIYAVGMLMTYMLTEGYSVSEIRSRKARSIAEKCTQFSPDRRYKSVSAIREAIKRGKKPLIIAATVAVVASAAVLTPVFFLNRPQKNVYTISPTNTYAFTLQADDLSDEMVKTALESVDKQAGGTVRAGKTKRQMIEYILNDSRYAVFGGKNWPCNTTEDERYFIRYVNDENLAQIDGTISIKLDTNSSASMSTCWWVSGVVYTEDISHQSYRVYVDGDAGKYKESVVEECFRKYIQAGEHIRIDETRSMSFVSCDDNGFYFIEYGSDDNSDHHLRFRYYTFSDFVSYLNSLNKQIWYYEIDAVLNE